MARYLRQGELNFAVGYKLQTRWGLTEAMVFTLEGVGAALVAATLLLNAPPTSMVIGVLMVALAIVLLLAHLGNPRRAWMAIRNPRQSWISRGTLVLGGFVGLGVLYLLLLHPVLAVRTGGLAAAIRVLLVAGGFFIALYPGLVLSASPAIPFWNSGLLPILSLVQGVASAVAVLLVVAAGHPAVVGAPLVWAEIWLLVAVAIVLYLYLTAMLRRGAAAAQSAAHLMQDHPLLFLVTCCSLGIALPLLLMLWVASGDGGVPVLAVLAVTAFLRLAGDLALRHAFLKVGMFDPVI